MTQKRADTRLIKLQAAAQSMGVVVKAVDEGTGRLRYQFSSIYDSDGGLMGSTVGLERAWLWLYGYGAGWTRGRLSVRSSR